MDITNEIEHLHNLNIIHGDIKSGNLLTENFQAKLWDFGEVIKQEEIRFFFSRREK